MKITTTEEHFLTSIVGEEGTKRISWGYDPEHKELVLTQRDHKGDWLYEDMDIVTIPRKYLGALQEFINRETSTRGPHYWSINNV